MPVRLRFIALHILLGEDSTCSKISLGKDSPIPKFIHLNPKRAGGAESAPPPRHFLLYLSRVLFFRAETS